MGSILTLAVLMLAAIGGKTRGAVDAKRRRIDREVDRLDKK